MTEPARLVRTDTVDLPVVEASGLTARIVGGRRRILVIGDRTAEVAAATVLPDGGLGRWDRLDLSRFEGWPGQVAASQFEALAADAGRVVALLREDPPEVLVADVRTRTLRARISLTAPHRSPLHGRWDDPSSRGEGLVLLRDGRLLVAKEKRPRALVEFCPIGMPAQGVGRDDLLDPAEDWASPDGAVSYLATAMWRLRDGAKEALRDISALAVGPDRSLWLLSDKSASVARLSLDRPLVPGGREIVELDEVWRLPKAAVKPEGIVALDDERVLVAMDTDSTHGNGIVVRRPSRR